MAASYHNLGELEKERRGLIATAVTWQVKAFMIRLHLDVPQAMNNLRRLAGYRRELGIKPFTSLLTEAVGDTGLAETITSLLDQFEADSYDAT